MNDADKERMALGRYLDVAVNDPFTSDEDFDAAVARLHALPAPPEPEKEKR